MTDFFQDLYKTREYQSSHYSISRLASPYDGMAALREFFPDAKADDMNFVLFSTSGVHGTYCTIEDVEDRMNGRGDGSSDVTFLIVHPRVVHLRYGNATPESQADIDFLKRLRANSLQAIAAIGMPAPKDPA